MITPPSPDVDFPFLVPYDYAAQSRPIMGWSMCVSKLHCPNTFQPAHGLIPRGEKILKTSKVVETRHEITATNCEGESPAGFEFTSHAARASAAQHGTIHSHDMLAFPSTLSVFY